MFEVGQPVQLKPGAPEPLPKTTKVFRWPYECQVSDVCFDTSRVRVRIRSIDGDWVKTDWMPTEDVIPAEQKHTNHNESTSWTNEKLGALCREWQGAMYLADWEVVVKYVGIREMRLKHARSECQWLTAMKQAEIRILRIEDRDPDVDIPQDPEVDLVHELQHLHWAPAFDLTEPDSAERTMLEQGIQANARAMVRLKREGETK